MEFLPTIDEEHIPFEDNLEFIEKIEAAEKSTTQNYSVTETSDHETEPYGISHKRRKYLRNLAARSHLSERQTVPFLSAVELDSIRKQKEQIGMERLFTAYCVSGNKYWLNPEPYISQIDGTLFKYSCRGEDKKQVLLPIINLLIKLANAKINPTAFLKYIILPRIQDDMDWRSWNRKHLEIFNIIAGLLYELKQNPPFNRQILGRKPNKLARDIVLVKYAGKPLSLLPNSELDRNELKKRYINAWRTLSLDNAFSIYFMKLNVLNILYTLAGNAAFAQIIKLIEEMQGVEEAFEQNFPPEYYAIDVRSIHLNLYDVDPSDELNRRFNQGFRTKEIFTELESFLRVVVALLHTRSGIYTCSFFTRRLALAGNYQLATQCEELIRLLRDTGGKHIYTWHGRKLFACAPEHRREYIEYIRKHDGCDPDYPLASNLFISPAHALSETALMHIIDAVGLSIENLVAQYEKIYGSIQAKNRFEIIHVLNSLRGGLFSLILATYKEKYPEHTDIINTFQKESALGKDSSWNNAFIKKLDSIGTTLHGALLKSVIKGLTTGIYSVGLKSHSFVGLFSKFSTSKQKYNLDISRKFSIPVKDIDNVHKFTESEIRKHINLTLFSDIFQFLTYKGAYSIEKGFNAINSKYLSIIQNREDIGEKMLALETSLKQQKKADLPHIQKQLRNYKRSYSVLESQLKQYQSIMSLFETANEAERILLLLIVAAKTAKPKDELSKALMSVLKKRYASTGTLKNQIDYLSEDVSADLITYSQCTYIIGTLETLNFQILSDNEIQTAIQNLNERDESNVAAFLTTKRKELSAESVDASFKKFFDLSKLYHERARWQEIMEDIQKQDDRYYHPYTLYVSKSPLDAYYGDMGGICLSGTPEFIQNSKAYVLRLSSIKNNEIIGVGLLYASDGGLEQYFENSVPFWHAFAFNPLRSLLNSLSQRQQLYLYMQFRALLESIAKKTKMPVVLSGINTWGIISNDDAFRNLIMSFENRFHADLVEDARGLNLYYREDDFRKALLIIDPKKPDTMLAKELLKNFRL